MYIALICALILASLVGGALCVLMYQAIARPRTESAALRTDLDALKLDFGNVIDQFTRWNKRQTTRALREGSTDAGGGEKLPDEIRRAMLTRKARGI